jgi:hypothetical protein
MSVRLPPGFTDVHKEVTRRFVQGESLSQAEQEMNHSERGLEALSWDELEQAVERFVAADGPNTGDLPADEFFTLWARFEAERRRVVEVEGEIVGEKVKHQKENRHEHRTSQC